MQLQEYDMSTNEAELHPTINDVLRALVGSIVRHVRPAHSPPEVVQNHSPVVSTTATRGHDATARVGSPSNIVPSVQSQPSHYETARVLFRFHEPAAHHSALSSGSELSRTRLEPSSTADNAAPLVLPSATTSVSEHTSHLSEMLPQISAGTEIEPIFDSESWLPSLSAASSERTNPLANYRVRRHITLIDVGPRPDSAADEHSTDSSALSSNNSEWLFETPSPTLAGAVTSTWPVIPPASNNHLVFSNRRSTSTLLDVGGSRVASRESEIVSNWEQVHQNTDLGLTRADSVLTSWQLFDRIITQLLNQVDSGPSPAPSDVIASIPCVTVDAEMIAKISQCTICLEDFMSQEVVRRISCGHIFHSGCIVRWLELHGTCPVCRTRLVRSVTDHQVGAFTDGDRMVLSPATAEHVGDNDPSSDVVVSLIDDVSGILSPESSSTVAMSSTESTASQRNLSAAACTIAPPDAAVVLPDVAIAAVEANTSRMLAGEAHDSATAAAVAVDDDSVRPSQVSLVLFRLFNAMHFQD